LCNQRGGAKISRLPDSQAGSSDSFRLESIRDGDSITLSLTGELDQTTAEAVDLAIRSAEESQIGAVVVDLSALTFIDSTGLSVLLAARKRDDDRLAFVPPTHDSVARLLALTGTTELFS
jgi:anti-anti-sigma factor